MNDSELGTERIKERIQAEARPLQANPPLEKPDMGMSSETQQSCGDLETKETHHESVNLKDLLLYQDEAFIRNAYRTLLKREPDPDSLRGWLENLRSGQINRIVILGEISRSEEGRKRNIAVNGLWIRYWINKVYKIPVAGYLIRVLMAILNLPEIIRNMGAYQMSTDARLEDLWTVIIGKADAKTVVALAATAQAAAQDVSKQISDHRLNLLDQQRHIFHLLDEVRRRFPESNAYEQFKHLRKEEDHLFDVMQGAFEDRCRGTREDIKESLRVFLPYIKQANTGERSSLIVDIGCGSGEWLELLKEEGYAAKGVEINGMMAERCRERNLDVEEDDAIEYLRSLKAGSIGVITAFQLIEYLPLKYLISFFDEALRVLKPKGMMICEISGPENLIVGTCTFHSDPTHRFLLLPESLNFMARQRGFVNTNILRLHNYSDFNPVNKATANDFKNKRFYSETDFALIGYKS